MNFVPGDFGLTPVASIFAPRWSVPLWCLLLLSLCCLIFAQLALAQERNQKRAIDFDISAQPLDRALDAFSTRTGVQIFYETALTSGHRSKDVKGHFGPETALQILLEGSELTAKVIAVNTFTIALSVGSDLNLRVAKGAAVSYYGLMQAGVMRALCRRADTRPGNYRVAVQYSIDDAGQVAQFRLIGSTGEKQRDDAIERAIRDITFEPLLRNIPQPVTLLIGLGAPDQPDACASDHTDPAWAR